MQLLGVLIFSTFVYFFVCLDQTGYSKETVTTVHGMFIMIYQYAKTGALLFLIQNCYSTFEENHFPYSMI